MRKKTNDENSNKYPCDKYVKFVKSLCGKYSPWEIWNDFINLFAISLNNSVRHEHWEEREKQYLQIVRTYTSEEQNKMTELSAMLINDMSNNADYDYLGKVYMDLRINCNEKGQFFTPYHISKLMAKLVNGDSLEEPIIINEPTCGSGTNIIAMANVLKERGFNYQQNAYFVAQDIDPLVAKMCYIQMALLGMSGVVLIGDTLANNTDEMEHWYTPFHYVFGIQILSQRKKNKEKENEEEQQSEEDDDWLLSLVGLA